MFHNDHFLRGSGSEAVCQIVQTFKLILLFIPIRNLIEDQLNQGCPVIILMYRTLNPCGAVPKMHAQQVLRNFSTFPISCNFFNLGQLLMF